eukprot:SAG31_NODE_3596_length_4087_cov_28.925025_6_plen_61_part_00
MAQNAVKELQATLDETNEAHLDEVTLLAAEMQKIKAQITLPVGYPCSSLRRFFIFANGEC